MARHGMARIVRHPIPLHRMVSIIGLYQDLAIGEVVRCLRVLGDGSELYHDVRLITSFTIIY